jgi:hypothetical protein
LSPSSWLHPILDLIPEVRYQLFRAFEFIGDLRVANVFVVALAGFIVESQDANLVNHECQAILKSMAASGNLHRYFPNHDVDKTILGKDSPLAKEETRRHVGVYTNTGGRSSRSM